MGEGYASAAVAAGWDHALALKKDGSLVSWGRDDYGQVTSTPTGSNFVAIACGYDHSVALRSDGTLAAWGFNAFNQCNNVPTGNQFTAMEATAYGGLALTPVPEPATVALLGLCGLLLRRRRSPR